MIYLIDCFTHCHIIINGLIDCSDESLFDQVQHNFPIEGKTANIHSLLNNSSINYQHRRLFIISLIYDTY